jgi:hypothetical protein
MLRCVAMLTLAVVLAVLFLPLLGCSRRSEEPIKVERKFFENKEKLKATK